MATANNIWYNVKTRYIGTTEDGITKAITEEYLTAALSFTEAEKKTSETALAYGHREEFDIIAMSRTKFSEIVNGDKEADKWFKGKINAITLDERNGREKKTSETALAYGHREEFDIIAMSRTKFSEIVNGDKEADKWFKCKINAITLDERNGREKKTPIFFCVNAGTALEAHHRLDEHLKKTMMDYTVEQVDETKIIEVIK